MYYYANDLRVNIYALDFFNYVFNHVVKSLLFLEALYKFPITSIIIKHKESEGGPDQAAFLI